MNYTELLNKALEEWNSFSLVWQDDFDFNENARKIETKLKPFLINEKRTDEWPGTKIFGRLATLRQYGVLKESILELETVGSINSWMAPDYPEDLAFYKDGRVAFASITHEGDQWFSQET